MACARHACAIRPLMHVSHCREHWRHVTSWTNDITVHTSHPRAPRADTDRLLLPYRLTPSCSPSALFMATRDTGTKQDSPRLGLLRVNATSGTAVTELAVSLPLLGCNPSYGALGSATSLYVICEPYFEPYAPSDVQVTVLVLRSPQGMSTCAQMHVNCMTGTFARALDASLGCSMSSGRSLSCS